MFQSDLGTLLDKTHRVESLITPLAAALGMLDAQATAAHAARLARADLASSTVMEMTALAGTMGRHYALQEGLPSAVAEAIFESVLPRQAGDMVPSTSAGCLVAIADRLDSLVGLFAAGCAPTASADPYALRRTAYGMLQVRGVRVWNNYMYPLPSDGGGAGHPHGPQAPHRHGFRAAAHCGGCGVLLPTLHTRAHVSVTQKTQQEVWDFVVRRLEQLLVDEGLRVEAVRAVLSQRGNDPALAAVSARAAHEQLQGGQDAVLARVLAAMARPVRIMRGKEVDADVQVFVCYVSVMR